ncbi:MAG: hypothetical protein AAF318_17855 [Pseudomonadota bacterium]
MIRALILLLALTAPALALTEEEAAREISSLLAGAGPHQRISVVEPAAGDNPLAPGVLAARMARIAAKTPVAVLAPSEAIKASLAEIHARQGQEGWLAAAQRLGPQAGQFVLLGDARVVGAKVSLNLTVVRLADGAQLGTVGPVFFDMPARQAGRAGPAIAAAVARLSDRARVEGVTVLPLTTGGTERVSPAGVFLRTLVEDAWLARHGPSAVFRGAERGGTATLGGEI